MSNVMSVTDADFDAEVIKSAKPVLVDFWAAWCGPCRMIAPEVESLAEKYKDKLKVVKLNIDENNKVAAGFGVMSIPTLILFKNGKEVERLVGYQSKDELSKKLDKKI